MKYALISEEQIQEIKSLMHPVRNSYAGETTLSIIQSLKPQEPVASFVQHLEYGSSTYHQVAKRYNADSDVTPLFALEQT
jgi:hypothetical protein